MLYYLPVSPLGRTSSNLLNLQEALLTGTEIQPENGQTYIAEEGYASLEELSENFPLYRVRVFEVEATEVEETFRFKGKPAKKPGVLTCSSLRVVREADPGEEHFGQDAEGVRALVEYVQSWRPNQFCFANATGANMKPGEKFAFYDQALAVERKIKEKGDIYREGGLNRARSMSLGAFERAEGLQGTFQLVRDAYEMAAKACAYRSRLRAEEFDALMGFWLAIAAPVPPARPLVNGHALEASGPDGRMEF